MLYEIHSLSEKSVSLYFEQKISPEINDTVLSATQYIKEHPFCGLEEVVPGYASLTVFYDLLAVKSRCSKGETAYAFVKAYLRDIPFSNLQNNVTSSRLIEIPVQYNGADLAFVAEHNKISELDVVKYHTEPEYRVYMMGFLPGFAYLGGMSRYINAPRKKTPRLKVSAGSVGIAGGQTGIYPVSSPGGWQLIGETETVLFSRNEERLTLLETGDRVKFIAV